MIDPDQITNYERTYRQLEEFLLFCVFVAGHNAHSTADALDGFLSEFDDGLPVDGSGAIYFYLIHEYLKSHPIEHLQALLRKNGIGCYKRNAKFIEQVVNSELNLRFCSTALLERFVGIGPKTSRFFVLHSRKDVNNVAVLDTHTLKYLKSLGHKVPKSTPSGKRYRELELAFLQQAARAGKSVADFDLEIWKRYRVAPKDK